VVVVGRSRPKPASRREDRRRPRSKPISSSLFSIDQRRHQRRRGDGCSLLLHIFLEVSWNIRPEPVCLCRFPVRRLVEALAPAALARSASAPHSPGALSYLASSANVLILHHASGESSSARGRTRPLAPASDNDLHPLTCDSNREQGDLLKLGPGKRFPGSVAHLDRVACSITSDATSTLDDGDEKNRSLTREDEVTPGISG